MADLNTDVRYIKGIGEVRAKALNKLGIYDLGDLVSYFPRGYDDRRVFKKLDSLIVGESVCVRATVASEPRLSRIRKGLDLVKFRVVDDVGSMGITYFNQSFVKNSFHIGDSFIFYGKVGGKIGMPEMTNPIFEQEDGVNTETGRIMPVYPLTARLSQKAIRSAVRQGLFECDDILPDPLPPNVRKNHHFAQSRYAYNNIHFPQDFEALELSRRRFIFEELFVLSCAMSLIRSNRTVKKGIIIPNTDLSDFYAALPFELTFAQKRSISEALNDMASGRMMSRLVQGDVGSGKTIVAAALTLAVHRAGYQSAFMAPTEILAEQHYKNLTKSLSPFGIKCELLTGGMKASEKRAAHGRIASGEADVIIGTHALISETVEYKRLALVIADEQHRFGVEQRTALAQKGGSPHVLVMSATPIPRTLALIIYGEMDVSVIDELPPGRENIDTFVVGNEMRARIYNFIRKQIDEGHQVYIVCPMVEENEEYDAELKSVTEYSQKLQNTVFPDKRVSLVHGKMKPKDKDAVMSDFARGEIDILVATTVIEVGVDVPNATLIVIENAERFGLSQLHQLRGRVGRGKNKSYCVLFSENGNELTRQRLSVMTKTNDGFKISEEDLKLRGPGDFFGKRQHGLPELRVASFATDIDVLTEARKAAEEVIERDRDLVNPENEGLRKHIEALFRRSEDIFN